MNYLEEYDETDPISIETYAKRLIGKTFASVITMGSGGNGGMFGPSVIVGGLLGFVFAFGLHSRCCLPQPGLQPV